MCLYVWEVVVNGLLHLGSRGILLLVPAVIELCQSILGMCEHVCVCLGMVGIKVLLHLGASSILLCLASTSVSQLHQSGFWCVFVFACVCVCVFVCVCV